MKYSSLPFIVVAALAAIAGERPASAQSVADFYRGRSLQMLVGFPPGGTYDVSARTLARHIGRHIPGNPNFVAQNMPGAGSLRLTNFLYNVAPKDGTVIGMVGRGQAMAPLIGSGATQYDSRRFNWIGSVSDEVSLCVTWRTSKVKSWGDALRTEFTFGGEGPGSDTNIFTMMVRNLFGAKIQLVAGYPGAAEMNLAMERNEIDGRCWSWSAIKITKPEWIEKKSLNLLIQMALRGNKELEGIPIVADFARSERDKQILRLVLSRQEMAWPFVLPPDVPQDRATALRAAFDATMKDPAYLEEARQRGLGVDPMRGADINRLVDELYATPSDAIAATRAAISENTK